MKRNLNVRILALAMTLLLWTLPVVAEERPFALTGNGVATFITDGAGNIIGANVTGSGTATHLGLWTVVGTVHFTPDPDNPGRLLSSATTTFTAANGDKFHPAAGRASASPRDGSGRRRNSGSPRSAGPRRPAASTP